MTRAEHERRIESRREPAKPLFVEYPDYCPRILDISMNGALIEDPRPLRPGRLVRLILTDRANPAFEIQAIVRRIIADVGMTVEFVEMTKETQRRLRSYLGTREDFEENPLE